MSAPLRVAIDLTQVDNQSLGSGQFRYAVDLVGALCALDDPLHVTVLGSSDPPVAELRSVLQSYPGRCRHIVFTPYRGQGYYYFDLIRLTAWLARHRVDVLHQMHTNIPPLKPCPVVVTTYHYYRDDILFSTRPYRYYRWALQRRADLVIAISNATRDDMHRHFGIPLERMRTVYPGLSRTFGAASAEKPPAKPYLLSPYNLSAPKNLKALIAAWPSIADRDAALELVLYGRALVTDAAEAELDRTLRSLRHGNRIRRTGHVDDARLSQLYDGCRLFVFPSLVEGFGYPLVEAMAHGACCIARDASAMKEVGDNAAVLVETLDPDAIAQAAIALLADDQRRAAIGRRARERAAGFTLERMARETLACYRAAAGSPPGPAVS